MKNSPKTRGFIIGLKGGLLWGIPAGLISVKYHFFIYAYLVMLLTSGLGAYYGVRYMRGTNKSNEWLKLLFWSNTVTWIVPPIGFFTYGATHSINLLNHDEDRKLFNKLSDACFWLSFVNAIILAKYLA